MEENKRARIGFEDTDKKLEIEIYGEKFEISEEKIGELKTDSIAEEKDIDVMEKMMDDILGAGAVEKLNKIRKDNGYEKMSISNELAIFMKLIEIYAERVLEPITEMERTYSNVYNTMNRYERRNYNRNYRNNRYNDRYRR